MSLNNKDFVLIDQSLQKQLENDGIVALPCISNEDVSKLTALFEQFHVGLDESYFDRFHIGVHSNDLIYKKKLHESTAEILDKYLPKYFANFRRLIWTMQIKGRGANSIVPLHQDWTIVNEQQHSSFTVWIPLCDSDLNNGCIHAIPGSHLLPAFPRFGSLTGEYNSLHNELLPAMKPYPCKAGAMLIFNNRLLHFSPPNLSENYRISVISLLVPKSAQTVLYHRNLMLPDKQIEEYRVSDDFHLYFNDFLEKQSNFVPAGEKTGLRFNYIEFRPTADWVNKKLNRIRLMQKIKGFFKL